MSSRESIDPVSALKQPRGANFLQTCWLVCNCLHRSGPQHERSMVRYLGAAGVYSLGFAIQSEGTVSMISTTFLLQLYHT